MKPCPCGYYGDPCRACTCAAGTVARYQKREPTGARSQLNNLPCCQCRNLGFEGDRSHTRTMPAGFVSVASVLPRRTVGTSGRASPQRARGHQLTAADRAAIQRRAFCGTSERVVARQLGCQPRDDPRGVRAEVFCAGATLRAGLDNRRLSGKMTDTEAASRQRIPTLASAQRQDDAALGLSLLAAVVSSRGDARLSGMAAS